MGKQCSILHPPKIITLMTAIKQLKETNVLTWGLDVLFVGGT